MRFNKNLSVFFLTNLVIANALAVTPPNNPKILLDQSKDVLFEQFASNNFSLQLMQSKNKFDNQSLVLGGVGELDWQHWTGDEITTLPPESYKNGSAFYFTQATFDMMANYTNWFTEFLSISANHLGQGGPDGNYVYFPHAFFLFGNLDKFPVYLTVGLNTIAFGNFVGSGVWNSPLTSNYFAPQPGPQLNLGFFKNNWDLSATWYADTVNQDNNVVLNLNYNNTIKDFNYGFGVGHINDLKSNSTGNPTIVNRHRRFNTPNDMGQIWDANATLGYKLVSLTGEYLTGSKLVGTNDANPKAFNFSFYFTPTIFNKVTTFGVSRSVSLNLKNIPTTLAGKDAIPLAASGIKNITSLSVSRTVFADNITLGLDAEKAVTYAKKQTFTYTLDLLAYL